MKYGYARISPLDPNPAAQLHALRDAGCEKIFTDKFSGASSPRTELKHCLEQLKAGDMFVVSSLDRLARSVRDLANMGTDFQERGIAFRSLTEGINTSEPSGKVAFQYFAAVADFQSKLSVERTHEGLARAKARGVKVGRKHKLNPQTIEIAQKLITGGEPPKKVAAAFGVTYQTLSSALATAQPS